MARSRVFFGGVPVQPDVDRLMERFGALAAGVVISHDEIAAAIELPYGSTRYRTIVSRWTQQLWDERNVRAVAKVGVGIEILSGAGRLDQGVRQMRYAARRAERATKEALTTPLDDLDSAGVRRREHLIRSASMQLVYSREAVRQFRVAVSKPAKKIAE